MDQDKIFSILNDLIKTSKDGEQGFTACAEDASSPELSALFQEAATRCAGGAQELQNEIQKLGGNPASGSSISGTVHRGWLNVKSAVTGKNDQAILNEAERGEDVAMKSYKKALDADLPPDIHALVERQFQGVQENHDRVRALRDQHAAH